MYEALGDLRNAGEQGDRPVALDRVGGLGFLEDGHDDRPSPRRGDFPFSPAAVNQVEEGFLALLGEVFQQEGMNAVLAGGAFALHLVEG